MPIIEGDLFRPEHDMHGVNAALDQVLDLEEGIKYCLERRVAVQAGGNCGIFPRYLAKRFKFVYTFEPENENFFCLVNNAEEPNIIKFQAALGDKDTLPAGLMYDPKNAGGHHLKDSGVIPVIALDTLHLPVCDFLQIDIEGYEIFALKGAEDTIKKYSPVIMIEHKKHATRYGMKPEDIFDYLGSLGYTEKMRVRRDIIFTKGENNA